MGPATKAGTSPNLSNSASQSENIANALTSRSRTSERKTSTSDTTGLSATIPVSTGTPVVSSLDVAMCKEPHWTPWCRSWWPMEQRARGRQYYPSCLNGGRTRPLLDASRQRLGSQGQCRQTEENLRRTCSGALSLLLWLILQRKLRRTPQTKTLGPCHRARPKHEIHSGLQGLPPEPKQAGTAW